MEAAPDHAVGFHQSFENNVALKFFLDKKTMGLGRVRTDDLTDVSLIFFNVF